MTNRLRGLLQAGAVALVAACGGTTSDDVVIRTDVEGEGRSAAAPATQADAAAAPTAGVDKERAGR